MVYIVSGYGWGSYSSGYVPPPVCIFIIHIVYICVVFVSGVYIYIVHTYFLYTYTPSVTFYQLCDVYP